MPENKDDRLFLFHSFCMYLEHLEPSKKDLWQTILQHGRKKSNLVQKVIFGKNTLSGFMTDLSKECKLSKMYTNHSTRFMGITVLT